jgi:hypothetical protein
VFSWEGVVSTSPNPQAGGPPLVGCPQLLIQFIHSYPPYRRLFLHLQPEDAPCRGDRDPHSWKNIIISYIISDLRFSDLPTFTAVFGVTLTLKEGKFLQMPPIFIILILHNTQKTSKLITDSF